MMHGVDLDSVHNELGCFSRAARQLIADVDLFESKRKTTTPVTLYDSVYDYSAPTNLKADKIIDIRKQVARSSNDNFDARHNEYFDLTQKDNTFSVEYRNNTKVLRVNKQMSTVKVIDGANATTGWSVGGDATNLTLDSLNYVAGSGALKFDLSGASGTAHIENSTITDVDLTTHEDESSLFVWVFFPDSSIITNVDLRWGSDSSNYWNRTVTAGHFAAFTNGWNLLRFDWDGATETGSPVVTAVDYVRVTINYDGTVETDIRVDNIVSNFGSLFDVLYYGDQIFQNSSGTYISSPTSDDDVIVLEDQSINMFLYKVAEIMSQQMQQQGQSVDVQYFANEYAKATKHYKQKFPSQAIKPKGVYYSIKRTKALRTTL